MSAECEKHGVDLHGDMFSGLVCPVCEREDALSACQEELARASTLVDYHQALAEGAEGELARVQQEAKIEVVSAEDRALTARATRDELAQAILAPDGVEAIRLARAALSSEATKGET